MGKWRKWNLTGPCYIFGNDTLISYLTYAVNVHGHVWESVDQSWITSFGRLRSFRCRIFVLLSRFCRFGAELNCWWSKEKSEPQGRAAAFLQRDHFLVTKCLSEYKCASVSQLQQHPDSISPWNYPVSLHSSLIECLAISYTRWLFYLKECKIYSVNYP